MMFNLMSTFESAYRLICTEILFQLLYGKPWWGQILEERYQDDGDRGERNHVFIK